MIAVIFEVWPREDGRADYLATAAALRAELETVDGFISVERFESLTTPGKVLSLSFFRDEAAVRDWRTRASHRAAQARGRGGLFADYRIRVASILRDYGLQDRAEVPVG
ncbi:antibiotic biosynthesis monooxygenase [Frigidibacter sp. RF13]|uniref:antibiotic biosynthesis monooxygenase family protein n=1 Tax=Frigidibacter sp. RF13 TaxID=2997340 RepID=UPI00226E267D|nr:antibiotic biosynthesis monooxygenase [Frigidibacter sp. RF13]MCY1127061.1 antibiotic biosynthesis monooxygenase [Frigidibacter sp. RF13]